MKEQKCCSWRLLWCGLPKVHEYLFSLDQFSPWRKHQVWAHRDGAELRSIVSQRFASNMVFLSLLLSTQVGILFSPSIPANTFREHLKNADLESWGFWAGFALTFGVFITVCALYTNFVVWGITANIGKQNVHALLRSSIGMYAVQLPNRLIVASIYLFFLSMLLLLGILVPHGGSLIIFIIFVLVMLHINSTYSALGRIILETGAMGDAVFCRKEEESMSPDELFDALLEKVHVSRKANIPVHRIYRMDYRKSLRNIQMGVDITTDDHPPANEQENQQQSDVDLEEGKQQEKTL